MVFDSGQRKANRRNEANFDAILSLFGMPGALRDDPNARANLFGVLADAFNAGLPHMQGAVDAVRGGTQGALQQLSSGAIGSAQMIRDREQQALSSLGGRFAGYGGSSTAGQAAQRGIFADTTRQLMGLEQGYAGQRAGIMQRGGLAEAGALQNLAQYYTQKAQMGANLGMGLARARSGFQFQGGSSLFSQLAPLAGAAIGGMFGGPAGAAAGGSIGSAIGGGSSQQGPTYRYEGNY